MRDAALKWEETIKRNKVDLTYIQDKSNRVPIDNNKSNFVIFKNSQKY
jgi:hypothetical protein